MAYKRPRPSSPSASQKRSRGEPPKNIALGTEIPPEEDGDDGSFVPEWKQIVTDERGRRRFHGAFTGGYSAGYFNTVGSKEGWAPKAFVSSRANRNKDQAKTSTQRPEDFMDEEDLAQAAESRHLETAQSFAGIGSAGATSKDGFFGLFVTDEETMGVKIAQKMGWRRDQGVGRKIRRPASLGESTGNSQGPDAAHMFAPKDTRQMPLAREEPHRKGLGYQSEARLGKVEEQEAETDAGPALHFLESSKKSRVAKKPAPKKSSFGVGVLNDTGSDDEDPYELGPKITFNKTLGKEKKAKKPSKFAKPATGEKLVFVSKKAAPSSINSLARISLDGKPPLKGFVLAVNFVDPSTRPRYPPPKIPPGWKSSKESTSASDAKDFQSVADAARASTLDAKGRASLLGEAPLPGRSVFDFIPKEARDRLANLTGKKDLPQGLGQSAPEGHQPADKEKPKDLWSFVPVLDKSVAAAALAKGATGWMPYAEDLKKRARYVGFLELRAGLKDDLPERVDGMSVSDWVKELQEFAHAAQVFKPTTGIIASRFTSSTSSNQSTGGNAMGDTLLRAPATKPEDPAEQAAKLGMYGPMTRSSFPFHPSRLLCKRFNVKPPPDIPYTAEDGAGDFGTGVKTEEAVSKSAMDKMLHEMLSNGPALQRPAWMSSQASEEPTSTASRPTEHATVDIEKNEALSKDRVSEDVFKAIFGDDDDDE